MFLEKDMQERFKIIKSLMAFKHEDGSFICTYVQKMKSYINILENLGSPISKGVSLGHGS